jgi:hypothetical protein
MRPKRNLNIDTNVPLPGNQTITPYANKNYQDYFQMDSNKPLISPINYHPHMFPVSTKNHFNINMDTVLLQNLLDTPSNFGGFPGSFRIPAGGEGTLLNQTKEISMQDKILINEPENNHNNNFLNKNNNNYNFNYNCNNNYYNNYYNNYNNKRFEENKKNETENVNFNTPKFKAKAEEGVSNTEEKGIIFSVNKNTSDFDLHLINNKSEKQKSLEDTVSTKPKDSCSKRFSLDLDVVNKSDTTKIFSETVNNYKNEPLNKMLFSNQENQNVGNSHFLKAFSESAENEIKNENEIISRNLNTKFNNNNVFVSTNESGTISVAASLQEHKKVIFSTVHVPLHNIHMDNKAKVIANMPLNEADSIKVIRLGDNVDYQQNMKLEFLKNKYQKIIPMISPTRASLNISPKSAFVVNKKLFN